LAENKFSRYLIYAIGEIALVVIGIIIALQINNWNEINKTYEVELELYSKIVDDLLDEYVNTDEHLGFIKSYQDVNYHLYKETIGQAQFDSTQYYNSLQWIYIYHPIIKDNYLESLTTITNDEIRDLLKQYVFYENKTRDAFEEWNDHKVQHVRPFFSKHGIHNTEAVFNDQPYDFMSLVEIDFIEHAKLAEQFGTTELDELLFDLRFKTSWIIHTLKQLETANKELEKALKEKLI